MAAAGMLRAAHAGMCWLTGQRAWSRLGVRGDVCFINRKVMGFYRHAGPTISEETLVLNRWGRLNARDAKMQRLADRVQ